MAWPKAILPDYRSDRTEEHIQAITTSVRELQRMSQGKISLAGLSPEESPNADTAVVDVNNIDGGVHLEVNNPLGREPIGIIPIMGTGDVKPRITQYMASITVPNGSKTITCYGGASFSASMAGGYLVYRTYKLKIASYTNPTTIVLQDAAPQVGNGYATIIHKWEPDSVWLYFEGTPGVAGYWRLLFF